MTVLYRFETVPTNGSEETKFLGENKTHQNFTRKSCTVLQGAQHIGKSASNNIRCGTYEGLKIGSPDLHMTRSRAQQSNDFSWVLLPDFHEAYYFVRSHIYDGNGLENE